MTTEEMTRAIAELKRKGLWTGFLESHQPLVDELRDALKAHLGEEMFKELMERPDDLN